MSGATADLLHTLRGYVLMCRGTLNVKVTSAAVVVVVVVGQTEKVNRDCFESFKGNVKLALRWEKIKECLV